jgi:integrating conjugative element membrane protein (TIGR03745 family)
MPNLLKLYQSTRTRLVNRLATIAVAVLAAIMTNPVLAALPTAVTPASSAASGDYIAIAKEYFKNGFLFLGLLIAAYALITVSAGAIGKFNEFRLGRAELADVAVYAVVGVVILVIIVYLLTEAASVL